MTNDFDLTTVRTSVRAEHALGFVDLTDRLEETIAATGLTDGFLVAYCRHTTCGLLINEWEDGAQEDLLARLAALVPDGAYYAHDDLGRRTQNLVVGERANGRAHVLQMILGGTSQVVPVAEGRLQLGRWQRLFLLELDEPKERDILIQAVGRCIVAPGVPLAETCELERSR